jgi:uncharacterized protein (DUF488 family)
MVNIFMVGHSNYPLEQFIEMLQRENISVLYDIRVMPFSRYVPQYNQTTFPEELAKHEIEYEYRKELGPRIEGDESVYDNNGFNYNVALSRDRIIKGLKNIVENHASLENIVIMATKREPLECHRFLILAPILKEMGYSVSHILPEETITTTACEKKLIDSLKRRVKRKTVSIKDESNLLYSAYFAQSEKIALVGMKKYQKLRKKTS